MTWMRIIQLFVVIRLFTFAISSAQDDFYSEKLHLKSKGSSSVLAQLNFNFVEHLDDADTVKFSPVLHSLMSNCKVKLLEFSIAQGFWRSQLYGPPPEIGGASGVQLVARFDSATQNVEEHWKSLVQHLNSLFCSSFAVIGQTMSSRLQILDGFSNSSDEIVFYGAFTGDSICTENVESIKKLLPCHRTGLCQLLNNVEVVFESLFYSVGFSASLIGNEWSANVQANILKPVTTESVSVYELFKQDFPKRCSIANESLVFLEESPQRIIDLKSLPTNSAQTTLNLNKCLTEKLPVEVSTFVRENHLVRGKFISKIESRSDETISAIFTHMIPWQINVWFSTIEFKCQNNESKYKLKLQPRIVLQSPTLIEMSFDIPPQSTCYVSYEFQKGFLHFKEFPPDASNGIHSPGPILTLVPPTEMHDRIHIYSEPAVIPIPTPDFDKPFLVICIMCTITAMVFQRFFSFTTQYLSLVDKPTKEGLISRMGAKAKAYLKRKQKTD